MRTIILILTLALACPVLGVATSTQAADPNLPPLIRDGYFAKGIDGRVSGSDESWFLTTVSDVNDGLTLLPAGAKLRILPSAELERIIADLKMRPDTDYRIWARVTRYRDTNYLFPIHFLPLSKVAIYKPAPEPTAPSPEPNEPNEPAQPLEPTDPNAPDSYYAPVAGPNDLLNIPQEILDKIRTGPSRRRTPAVDPNKIEPAGPTDVRDANEPVFDPNNLPDYKVDTVMISRAGFVTTVDIDPTKAPFAAVFEPDGLGMSVQSGSYRILPSGRLEMVQTQQKSSPERMRFRIAGIVTEFKGDKYMLLQQAIIVRNLGNFGR